MLNPKSNIHVNHLSNMKNLGTLPKDVKQSDHGKILFSDVVIIHKRNHFWDRNWNPNDVQMVVWMLAIHLLALFAPFTFTWGAFWAAFWSYVLCWNLGVSVSYHRNLAHRSLKLPKWLEYTFAYFGVLSFTGDPIFWVSMHRYHHQYVDSDKDPHSPVFGFWFSHMGWLFDRGYIIEKYQKHKNVEDLQRQTFYRFLQRTYTWHICGFVALVYAYGGFTSLVWVVGVRTIWGYHVTFLVNSLSHIWGVQTWKTGDLSKNNWWLALISFGEGWHNNHHAFEYSARHGLEWWEIDMGWYTIRFLKALGLASNVKFPTKAQKLKKSSASLNS